MFLQENWLCYGHLWSGDGQELNDRGKLVGVIGLYILHYHVFHSIDKKTFKLLWDLHKKVHGIWNSELIQYCRWNLITW